MFERVIDEHELSLSPHILREFKRVMAVKIGLSHDRVKRALALLGREAQVMEPDPLGRPVCRDPDDAPVFALACSVEADCLVTEDDVLLVLTSFGDIPMIPPREFLTFKAR